MDNLDKKYKVKKFLKVIFRGIDFNRETIRTFQASKDGAYKKASFFKDIDELVDYSVNKYTKFNNTYFNLATVSGESGATKDLLYRYCLGFDFDKKDLGEEFNHKDIVNLFKKLKIYCHCIVDSGNGYHAYIIINESVKLL
ncbi:hypothetical protein [uncultured Clostridium sp.]|uniref:hypothetical protein n=1 Tax=uncultured Clostridium sp. TaxID=59620 RepID=UPI00259B17E7|nr:hypothetical protein [uncultured Clostridium sp.]